MKNYLIGSKLLRNKMNNLKNLKVILPDYPRTRHVPWKPNASRDDLVATYDEFRPAFISENVEITEKVDGSNCGMALFDGEPVIRNHNHILRKGYVKETPAKKQFSSVFNWFYENKDKFDALNGQGPFGVFGEWMIAQHGLEYNNLPSWFIAFDLYNYETSNFVSPKTARPILINAGFTVVPQLYFGKLKDFEQLEELANQPSLFTSKANREGIYIKVSDTQWVTNRYKMIREGFIQGGLWNSKKINKNTLLK